MAEYAQQITQIDLGHFALAACAVFYVLWWCVFFRPDAREKNTKGLRAGGIACIVLAVLLGILAVALIVMALANLPASIPTFILVAGGVALYVILLGITNVIMNRPVTTELLLIVAWFVLEANLLNGIAGTGLVTGASLIILGLVVFIAFVACIVCYVLYYGLSGFRSFVDGVVPLVIVALVSLSLALLLR